MSSIHQKIVGNKKIVPPNRDFDNTNTLELVTKVIISIKRTSIIKQKNCTPRPDFDDSKHWHWWQSERSIQKLV